MANNYFSNAEPTERFIEGETARGSDVDEKLDAVASGFDGVLVDIKRAIKMPSGADIEISGFVYDRANKVIGFDESGNLELQTGVGLWRNSWQTATDYELRDYFQDPVTQNYYIARKYHTSTTIEADLSAGKIALFIDFALLLKSKHIALTFATVADLKAATWVQVGQSVIILNPYAIYKIEPESGVIDEKIRISLATGDMAVFESGVLNIGATINVPSDYPTLQLAVDAAKNWDTGVGQVIDILIESGHTLTSGIIVSNGDYSHIQISSVDPVVTVSAGFGKSNAFIYGSNAKMPIMNCLVNGNAGEMGYGYRCENNSSGYVTAGSGATHCWQDGIGVRYGSVCYADSTVWTNNAINGTTSSGATCWSSLLHLENSDVSNSGYYGAQSAHGGVLGFKNGVANNTGRYGVRASDGALINFDGGAATGCAVYGVYAFNGCRINARDVVATGNGTANIVTVNASQVNASGATASGSLGAGAIVGGSSTLDAYGADFSNASTNGIEARASIVNAAGADCSGAGSVGVLADDSAIVNVSLCDASNCATSGIASQNGATINADGATADDCGQYGVRSWYGSTVNFANGFARRSGTRGVYAFSGSKINAKLADCRKTDGVDTGGSNADIVCLEGSEICAHGATGGVNKVVNTVNSDGIIYR